LASGQPYPRQRLTNAFENKPGSTANLEEASRSRKVIAERPLDKPVPRAKPDVIFLKSGEFCEIFGLESVAGHGRIFDKTRQSIAQDWSMPAVRTIPGFAFKAALAGEAKFHHALTP